MWPPSSTNSNLITQPLEPLPMKVAIVGCLHGKLDTVYWWVNKLEKKYLFQIDLVIICGDLQAVRGPNDLKCMSASDKQLGDFPDYYSGRKVASHLTLVVGGDQEPWNYLQTLPFGGWIAPNIFFMGNSNVVKFNGIRIGAISGIYNQSSVNKGYYETLPYDQQMIESVCHTRSVEALRMLQLDQPLDVMISHDWPRLMYEESGAKEFLLKKRPDLEEAIRNERLGSPMLDILVRKLKPACWFAAHLHTHFKTTYWHSSDSRVSSQPNKKIKKRTDFLALDRWAPDNTTIYFEVVEIERTDNEFCMTGLEHDAEWLAILKATDRWTTTQQFDENKPILPNPSRIDREKAIIDKKLKSDYKISKNFQVDMPYSKSSGLIDMDPERKQNYTNSQTTEFCALLGITDPMQQRLDRLTGNTHNPDAIDLSSDAGSTPRGTPPQRIPTKIASKVTCRPITIDEDVIETDESPNVIEIDQGSNTIETVEDSNTIEIDECPNAIETAEDPKEIEIDECPKATSESPNAIETAESSKEIDESSKTVELLTARRTQETNKVVEVVVLLDSDEEDIVEETDIKPPIVMNAERPPETVTSADRPSEIATNANRPSETATSVKRPPETATISIWPGINVEAARALQEIQNQEAVELDSEESPPKRMKTTIDE